MTMARKWLILSSVCLLSFFQYGSLKALEISVPRFIDDLDMTAKEAGLTCSIAAALATILGPLWSAVAHIATDKTVTILGSVLMALGLTSMSITIYIPVWVYISMIILGLGRGLPMVAKVTIIKQHFQKHFNWANGVASAGGSMGLFIIPPLVEILVHKYGWRGALMIFGAMCLNSIFAGFLMKDCKKDIEKKTRDILGLSALAKKPIFMFDLIAFTFLDTALYGWILFLFTFLTSSGLGFFQASTVSSCGGAGSLFGRMLFGPLLDGKFKRLIKLSPRILIVVSAVIGSTTLLLYPYVTTYVSWAVLAFFTGVFTGTTTPVYTALIDQMFSKKCDFRAAIGLHYMARGIGMLCGGPLTGFMYDRTGSFDTAFVVLAAFQFTGGVLFCIELCLRWIFHKRIHGHLHEENDKDDNLRKDLGKRDPLLTELDKKDTPEDQKDHADDSTC